MLENNAPLENDMMEIEEEEEFINNNKVIYNEIEMIVNSDTSEDSTAPPAAVLAVYH